MKPIEKISVTDAAVLQLKNLITSGELTIGDKLPSEKEIGLTLNIGRSTVRESLRVLQAMGFVEIKKGRGSFVAKTSEDDTNKIIDWVVEHEIQVNDFMEVRMAIEPSAIKLAIQRITDKEVQELEEIHETFEEAILNKDVVKLLTTDETFHKQIVMATHNKLLININEQVLDVFREYRSKSFAVNEVFRNALEPHRQILNAIKKHDIYAGVKAVINHLNITVDDMRMIANKKVIKK